MHKFLDFYFARYILGFTQRPADQVQIHSDSYCSENPVFINACIYKTVIKKYIFGIFGIILQMWPGLCGQRSLSLWLFPQSY